MEDFLLQEFLMFHQEPPCFLAQFDKFNRRSKDSLRGVRGDFHCSCLHAEVRFGTQAWVTNPS
jgi:hypothetical protein